jgi:hypothetical protein
MGMLNPPPSKYLDRFCARIRITERGCWEWTRSRGFFGYGQFCYKGRQITTHRLIHTWMYGPIPPGLCVLHHCDNPPCCNPDHLYRGTHKDNTRDMYIRGRARYARREYREPEIASELLSWAIQAYVKGMPLREIARWCEKPYAIVEREVKRKGVYRYYARPHQVFEPQIQRIRELRAQGWSHLAIAKDLGVGETAVWKWIHKLGLQ